MQPTNKLRWIERDKMHYSGVFNDLVATTRQRILQQWWSAKDCSTHGVHFVNEEGEWRDVPVEFAEG